MASFYFARSFLSLTQLHTFVFVLLVFCGLATGYLTRTLPFFWREPPGKPLLISTFASVVIMSFLASFGVLMEPLKISIIFILV